MRVAFSNTLLSAADQDVQQAESKVQQTMEQDEEPASTEKQWWHGMFVKAGRMGNMAAEVLQHGPDKEVRYHLLFWLSCEKTQKVCSVSAGADHLLHRRCVSGSTETGGLVLRNQCMTRHLNATHSHFAYKTTGLPTE